MSLLAHVPRIVPTRRLVAVVVVLAPLWLLSVRLGTTSLGFAAVVALLAAVLIDAVMIPGPTSVDVERTAPVTLGLDEHGVIGYRVGARWPGTVRVRLYEALPAGVASTEAPGGAVPPLPPGVAALPALTLRGRVPAEVAMAVRGAQRGRHEIGPAVLRIVGPLGLVERQIRPKITAAFCTVTPSLAGVRRIRLLAMQHRLRDAGIRQVRLRGAGTSFDSLRDYRIGDDPRHIDWKATAKRRALITREYAVEQGQTVMILVDGGRLMTQLAGDRPRFEYALSAALMLADIAANSHDRVGAMVFDADIQVFAPPARGGAGVQRLRDALVPTVARLVEPDYANAFRTLAARHRKRSLIVMFTDVIDPRASASLVAHTIRARVRHLPIVVALRNDELVAAAAARSGATPRDLYASAAAEELLGAREAALERMRQAGVSVLDIAPNAMAAAVINRYLEVKARAAV